MRISEMGPFQLIHHLQKEDREDVPEFFEPGNFVVVQVNSRKFVGLLTDLSTEDQEAEVSLLRPPLPADVFHWPKNLANMAIPMPHILTSLELSEVPNNNYTLTEVDRVKLLQKKLIRAKK